MSKFLYFKFKGRRFKEKNIPISILDDIKAYNKIIIEMAAHLYKQDCKSKLPKNFKKKFQLTITNLTKGSSVTHLEKIKNDENYIENELDYFDLARNQINQIILKAGQDEDFSELIPQSISKLFKDFGKGLQDGESVLLSTKLDFKQYSKFDKSIQKKILNTPKSKKVYLTVFDGNIDSVKKSDSSYSILTSSTKQKNPPRGHFSVAYENYICKALTQNKSIRVKIFSRSSFKADDSIDSLGTLQHLILYTKEGTIFVPNPVTRIDEISKLKDGWLNGEGVKFTSSNLKSLSELITAICSNNDIPSPFIYPHPDNEISLEWSLGTWEVTCLISFSEKLITIDSFDTKSDEDIAKSFPLSLTSSESIKSFMNKIIKKSSGESIE